MTVNTKKRLLSVAIVITALATLTYSNVTEYRKGYNKGHTVGLEEGKQAAVYAVTQNHPEIIDVVAVTHDEAVVNSWQWIEVMNKTPVHQQFANGSRKLTYGDTCGIEKGGKLQVKGATSGNRLLVEYTAPGHQLGTPCPSGVIFFIDKMEFDSMTAKYHDALKSEKMDRDTVQAILANSH